ncbi:2-oxoglutarate dehydrogenase, E2 component, dihydrolipoamide succinyltransferase [Bacteroidetes/Chlorobi group bacterium Naka2016]|jgi:2-oxoglutarate dehydrogenase E2 component (dihydrolipoamide succinyltransferase)|nr:MAG: 2-oxoglutarate dehydrogenase, E2 component, dihydrolipoamide succinyltransferase [Bacteroidetes/Chlorobi group bacterium Naka2016]
MKVDVVMPKMGESLQEGTILRWLKNVGDRVERDEMILEISTDKVDTEVPSPVAGVLVEILAKENETVPVGAVIARIETEASETVSAPKEEPPAETATQAKEEEPSPVVEKAAVVVNTSSENLVDVVMPKMGESLQEGTILRWLKNVGDRVERDEMILEISTDKVDTEVPSPVAGVLVEILAKENETVPVGAVIARIATGEVSAKVSTPQPTVEEKKPETKPEIKQEQVVETPKTTPLEEQKPKPREGKYFFSPVVKEIAKQEGITEEELMTIQGTGIDGRVTKNDLLKYIEEKKSKKVAPTPKVETKPEPQPTPTVTTPTPVPSVAGYGPDVEIIPMDRVRQIIAQHMVYSKQTSAHVTSVHEADVTGIVRFREKYKSEFERREGFKLTYTPFFAKAAVEAIRAYPRVNVSVDGTNIIQHKRIHLGIATALEDGNLIVPVVKNADALSLSGLARAIYDLSTRARSKKLNPDDIQGGTFTLTNVGTFGTLFGTPVINQPQTAILGVGAIQKRPVVRTIDGEDVIVVRYMAYVSLTYDHRVIDGMLAGLYLTELVRLLESQNENTLSI